MKSYLVLGLGRFGSAVAAALTEDGCEVLAMDRDENAVNNIQGSVTHAVIGDCADEAVLRTVGAENFDAAVVAIGEDIRASILAAVLLKEQGVPYIAARAADELHARILKKVGADKVIMPERDMGIKFAKALSPEGILDMIELSDEYGIAEIKCPKNWQGKSARQLNLRGRLGITVSAVKTKDNKIISPGADYEFMPDDVAVITGTKEELHRVQKR